MTALRERAMVSLQSMPSLPRHVRIQFDPVRQAFAVLSPERVFWPNDISLDILRHCDGASTRRRRSSPISPRNMSATEDGCGGRRHRLPAGMVRQAAGEAMSEPALPPIGMLAELTHRCPLQCPYCSNPTELLKANRELDTADAGSTCSSRRPTSACCRCIFPAASRPCAATSSNWWPGFRRAASTPI